MAAGSGFGSNPRITSGTASMAELGSIFDPSPTGARGFDLSADVVADVRRVRQGASVLVEVPRALVGPDGVACRRAHDPYDEGDLIELHLPADFPSGGRLRLRGRGGVRDGGVAGDLLLTVRLEAVDGPSRSAAVGTDSRTGAWTLAAFVAGSLGLLGWLLWG